MLLQATPLRSTHSTESIIIESNDEEQIVQFHWKEVVIKLKVILEREERGWTVPYAVLRAFLQNNYSYSFFFSLIIKDCYGKVTVSLN